MLYVLCENPASEPPATTLAVPVRPLGFLTPAAAALVSGETVWIGGGGIVWTVGLPGWAELIDPFFAPLASVAFSIQAWMWGDERTGEALTALIVLAAKTWLIEALR